MAEEKRKILVLVEGAKAYAALMKRLLSVYQIVRNHDYRQFAATKEECNIVIKQNMNKGYL